MAIEAKKESGAAESISVLNQLTGSLQEAETKLEQAYEKNNYEQVKAIKEFILKLQVKISEELKHL